MYSLKKQHISFKFIVHVNVSHNTTSYNLCQFIHGMKSPPPGILLARMHVDYSTTTSVAINNLHALLGHIDAILGAPCVLQPPVIGVCQTFDKCCQSHDVYAVDYIEAMKICECDLFRMYYDGSPHLTLQISLGTMMQTIPPTKSYKIGFESEPLILATM